MNITNMTHDLKEKEKKKMKNKILTFVKPVWLFRSILFENTHCFSFVWADPAGGEIGASVNSWQKNTPGSALKTIYSYAK